MAALRNFQVTATNLTYTESVFMSKTKINIRKSEIGLVMYLNNSKVYFYFCLNSVFNLLKTKRNLLYIRNQLVPRSKRFLPWLQKPIS